MKKFDYYTYQGITQMSWGLLSSLGKDGFELVTVIYVDGIFYYYFKREV
jgi:hypothetical protein